MAFTHNPRAKVFIGSTAADSIAYSIYIKKIRWVAGAAAQANDDLILTDNQSSPGTVWATTATGANYVESDLVEATFPDGIRIGTIDRGTVYIYYK
jgi:hypothetical protein